MNTTRSNATGIADPALLAIRVQPNSVYCGLDLAAVSLPRNCSILGILRKGKVISASEAPKICTGDYILAIALQPMMIPELKFVLKKRNLSLFC